MHIEFIKGHKKTHLPDGKNILSAKKLEYIIVSKKPVSPSEVEDNSNSEKHNNYSSLFKHSRVGLE